MREHENDFRNAGATLAAVGLGDSFASIPIRPRKKEVVVSFASRAAVFGVWPNFVSTCAKYPGRIIEFFASAVSTEAKVVSKFPRINGVRRYWTAM